MDSGIAENTAVGEGTSQNSSLPLPGGVSLSSKVAKHIFNTENHEWQDLPKTANFLLGKQILWLLSNPLKGKW